jgi:hypothetical protein
VSLAKKLREVVAANFIEIARVETPAGPAAPVPADGQSAPPPAGTMPGGAPDLDAATEEGRRTAEAELDSLLTPLPTPVEPDAPAAAPEPEPVLPRLLDAVNAEGDIDFERVYLHQGLKSAPFTAEQAMNMLTALPRDLPLRFKRVTVRATLDAIGAVVGATPKDIVADAVAKRERLEAFAAGVEEESTAEVARLQEEIAALQAALKDTQKKRDAARAGVQSRIDVMDQVTVFFDYEEDEAEAAAIAAEAASEDTEVPAFMQEDAVLRLLGLANEGAGTEKANGSGGDKETEPVGARD